MSLINIQVNNLLEELIESLVAMGNDKSTLIREVVVDVVDYLHGHVRLPRTYENRIVQRKFVSTSAKKLKRSTIIF